MALNKYMHSRNIYKKPPNFGKLVTLCPEFSNVAKMDGTGKITINFKDPYALRVLTKSLLKSDFNLDVDIPKDRLVPTLPLRLNYILWIEDLLSSIKENHHVKGVDIGTGACAIYPLLAAVKNKWHMIGTEIDEESLLKAQDNVNNNHLQEFIKIKKNPSKTIIEHLFSEKDVPKFQFCMCNPPFYSSLQELCESRSPARPPPKNGFTGSPQELITAGGELQFCRKLITESQNIKDKVIIFTTMVGHKYNLEELIQDLKADGIKHTHTEFCQGRVTRWGLAWTYHDYDIYKLVRPRDKPRKKNPPIVYILPEIPNSIYDFETAVNKLKSILKDLYIIHNIIEKRGNYMCIDIIAKNNTWSNQRRKRRLHKRMGIEDSKRIKIDYGKEKGTYGNFMSHFSSDLETHLNTNSISAYKSRLEITDKQNVDLVNNDEAEDPEITNTYDLKEKVSNDTVMLHSSFDSDKKTHLNISSTAACKSSPELIDIQNVDGMISVAAEDPKRVKLNVNEKASNYIAAMPHSIHQNIDSHLNITSTSTRNNILENTDKQNEIAVKNVEDSSPAVHALLKLLKKKNEILLEIDFLDGYAGKEGLHQIVQYIKNNWK